MPNVFRIKGACFLAVMHFSIYLYHLCKPFSLLDFIASEFCFIGYVMKSLYSEVFCGAKYPYSFM